MKSLVPRSRITQIVKRGSAIYDKIKKNYEPRNTGKYLAIEPDTKKVYLGRDGAEAMVKAERAQPDKFFYLVKIGYDTAERIANTVLGIR